MPGAELHKITSLNPGMGGYYIITGCPRLVRSELTSVVANYFFVNKSMIVEIYICFLVNDKHNYLVVKSRL